MLNILNTIKKTHVKQHFWKQTILKGTKCVTFWPLPTKSTESFGFLQALSACCNKTWKSNMYYFGIPGRGIITKYQSPFTYMYSGIYEASFSRWGLVNLQKNWGDELPMKQPSYLNSRMVRQYFHFMTTALWTERKKTQFEIRLAFITWLLFQRSHLHTVHTS